MEQQPQNPGAPAQDSAAQGIPLPGDTAQSNAVQENTVQNNAAESTMVDATVAPAATALQSPTQDPAVDGAASAASAEAVAPAPAEPKRMGLYSLICLPIGGFMAYFIAASPYLWLYYAYWGSSSIATATLIISFVVLLCVCFTYCALAALIVEKIATRKLPWKRSLAISARATALLVIVLTIVFFCYTSYLLRGGY
ncbi:MAG: histidyl-tRNA synthetase [Rothia sp.]|uniref:histidyl-tRNA synthetase n=1 Tax=Rothia sp. (in: high G+C Gram-positive bacteria) TaxID=1885016 RepID=UPI001CB5A72C|nr:histidyl-tRNA synthetase [Rothia sp. (in: high G+C Gram-positive bacteria)]MBF1676010.1 histidyl-tRNA synthetase [Rothia sp. (in: high G+C Gram-positive bacteria)]